MKKTLLFIAAACCLLSHFATAQTKFTEGTIKYKIDVDSDNDQLKQMLANSEMVSYVKGKKSAGQMTMGAFMTMRIITDNTDKKVVMLMDMMGQKKQINMTDKDFKEYKKKNKTEYKIEYLDDTKTIAGYNCKKAIVTTSDGSKMEVWYTTDILVDTENMMGNEYEKVKGFPMQYQVAKNGATMTFTVSNVSTGNVDDKVFDIPTGYDIMTMEQLMQSQGASK